MMDYAGYFRVSKRGIHRCGCDAEFDNIDDAISHVECGDIEGFCENGIRRNLIDKEPYNDEYECVCGKKTDWYFMLEHHALYKKSCMTSGKCKKDSYCEVCNIQCASVINYEIHCKTEKHKRNKKGYVMLPLNCEICKIKCISQNRIKQHLQTKKHKDMVASGKIANEKLPLSCDICQIKCTSQSQIRAHLETKKHKKLASIDNIRQSISTQ